MREEGERIMRKRDEAKNRREIIHALSMIMQIGLSMMVCMSVSLLRKTGWRRRRLVYGKS